MSDALDVSSLDSKLIQKIRDNPYVDSKAYFESLSSENKAKFLEFLYEIFSYKPVIFFKFLESHPYFEDYMLTKNLDSYELTFLDNNLNVIYSAMNMTQTILPSIIFYDDSKKTLCVILYEPFKESYRSNVLDVIRRNFSGDVRFFICKQSFLNEIKNVLTLKHSCQKQDLDSDILENLLGLAQRFNVSDIHLTLSKTSSMQSGKCLFRLDGLLVNFFTLHYDLFYKLSKKLKLLCKLDINKSLIPQDGYFRIDSSLDNGYMSNSLGGEGEFKKIESKPYDKDLDSAILKHIDTKENEELFSVQNDIRASFLPTLNGESIVLRIPSLNKRFHNLKSLNMDGHILESLKTNLLSHNGLILVSGPTNSAKSTLLYNCLRFLNNGNKKIISLEDPIEQVVPGVAQCDIRNIGFKAGLKYVLRQDPDIIMVGEVRDGDALDLSLKAALSGHLVLASIHASDCNLSIARMLDLGGQKSLIDSTLKCIISQRLLKTLCPFCKEKVGDSFVAQGCHKCYFQGFGRRKLIQEMLSVDSTNTANFIDLEDSRKSIKEPKLLYRSKTLKDQALELYEQGVISYEESLL